MADEYVPKLAYLPGAVITPKIVLHRTLDKSDEMQAIAVVIMWKNGKFATDWSQMKVSELCMANLALDEQVRKTYRGEENVG